MKTLRRVLALLVWASVLSSCSPKSAVTTAPEASAPAVSEVAVSPAPQVEKPVSVAPVSPPVKAKPVRKPAIQASPTVPPVPTKPVPEPVAAPVPAPATGPLLAPSLSPKFSSAFSADPVTVTVPVANDVVLKYTLDGSDPSQGKAWPSSGLVVSQSGTLKIWGALPGGPSATAEQVFTIGEVWVAPDGTGEGTWQSPVATIDQAIILAQQKHIHRLMFEPGTWNVAQTLEGTWEWSGGWSGPGQPASSETILNGIRKSGTTLTQPGFVIEAAPKSSVTLTSLTIRSANSSYGAAVLVDSGARADVRQCRLFGGGGLYGYGLRAVESAAITLSDSTLYGGDGGSTIALSADKTAVKVVRCSFDAGTGDAISYGLNLTLTSLSLVSSVVWGGVADSSYGVGLYSSPDAKILGCTIVGGKGQTTWGVYLSESKPTIVDCLIGSLGKSKSYGLWINFGKSQPSALRSNGFFGAATGVIAGPAWKVPESRPTPDGAFLDPNGTPLPGQAANRIVSSGWGEAPDFKTLPSAGNLVIGAGEPLTGEAALDRAGRPRGPRPTLGAWATSPSS